MDVNRLFEEKQGVTFYECVLLCAGEPELVSNFNRLWGFKDRPPLVRQVDESTGYYQETFIDFVYKYVWGTL